MRFYAFWLLIVGSIPFILRNALTGVILYSVFNVVRPEMLFWGGSRGAKVFIVIIAATILSAAINGLIDFRLALRWNLVLLFLIYVALMLSIFASEYNIPLATPYATEILKVFVLCYLLTAAVKNETDLRKYLDAAVVATMFLAMWGVDQYFRGNYRLEGLGGSGPNADSNYASAHFVMIFPLAVMKIVDPRDRRDRLLGIFSSIAIVSAIICTQSRGGLLGLLTVVVLIVLGTQRKVMFISICVLILLIAAPFLTDDYVDRMGTMTQDQEEMDDSARSRIVLWRAGWMIFVDHPVVGTGYMTYSREKTKYAWRFDDITPEFKEKVLFAGRVVHSTIFQVLSEGGLVLAIPFFGLIGGTVIQNRKTLRRYRGRDAPKSVMTLSAVQNGLLGYLVSLLFINGLNVVFLYVWTSVSAVIRLQLEQPAEATGTQPEGDKNTGGPRTRGISKGRSPEMPGLEA